MKENPEYVQEIIEKVRRSPYPHHMSMELTAMAFDSSTIELELGEQHLQPFGLVHGGVIATLIDTATFWAVFMRLPPDAGLVNVDLKLNYLKAVKAGTLRAEGRSIKSGKSICYSEAHVFDGRGSRIAHGTSTLMILPGKGLETTSRKFL